MPGLFEDPAHDPRSDESLGEFVQRTTGIDASQEALERQLRAKIEEIQRTGEQGTEQPDPETEREAEVHRLKVSALGVIGDYNLHGLHERQEAKLADLHGLREQQAAQARHLSLLGLDEDTAKLDALAEMESQPDYVPGKNEEQRKRQRDSWLATHDGYRQAQQIVRSAETTQDALELEHHRVTDELHSLQSLIAIRITEMELIASFVGR